jgi:hypothetical protein
MDEDSFWSLVQRCHDAASGDMDRKCALLKSEIARLSKDAAAQLWEFYKQAEARSYTWELWGAAYVINGGCGDDSFSDFRSSLISRGRSAFEKALSDPDSLADEEFDAASWFYEGYQYDVRLAVEANLGQEASSAGYGYYKDGPRGKEWAEESVRELYPKLARKFVW